MKLLLLTAFATLLTVGCGPSKAQRTMFDAVRDGNIEAVKKYLDDGGDVNAKDEPGATPLHWAVNEDFKGSHKEMVELLISRGADVHATDDLLNTPLHWASDKEIAEILITAGADVNAKDHEGRTLIFTAARNAANAPPATWQMYRNLVELLIAKGAEVNGKDKSGETPLHVVVESYQEEEASDLCELLIAHGADLNETNLKGTTPLDAALAQERYRTAEVLRKHGGKATTAIGK